MNTYHIQSTATQTTLHFNVAWKTIVSQLTVDRKAAIIIDENVYQQHDVDGINATIIVVPSGETAKSWHEVKRITNLLLAAQLNRNAVLIGIGGGVVTDLVGFMAAIYKRGIDCVLIPTTILAMVDAAIGGKNGINVGDFKNMIGTITQPQHIIYDYHFLHTLPEMQWANGFAEIIKHAAIQDEAMFSLLKKHDLAYFQENAAALDELIRANVGIKVNIIEQDPTEKGIRKLLNFGHTLAHAIEKKYNLLHGFAVSIGMVYAAKLSRQVLGFHEVDALCAVLQQYHLPIAYDFYFEEAIHLIQSDKKAKGDGIDFILLQTIGQAQIQHINTEKIQNEYHYTSL